MIRPATVQDLPKIAELHGLCFVETWDTDFLSRLLAQPGTFGALATQDDESVGFVIARAHAGEAEILSLGVRPCSRRQALATALLRSALECAFEAGALEAFLEVGVNNIAARRLYARLGFSEVGTRPAYYRQDGVPAEDARILRRVLPI